MMKEVDARGLSCPEPLMLTMEALKSSKEGIRVLVTEPHQRKNVEKFVKEYGRTATWTEEKDGFAVVIE